MYWYLFCSCYANAVLQCLTSTKPLIIYLLQRSHSRSCTQFSLLFLCLWLGLISLLQFVVINIISDVFLRYVCILFLLVIFVC